MTGVGSLSYLGAPGTPMEAEPIGAPIKFRECVNSVMGVVKWDDVFPTHETVLAHALEQAGADLLLDAKLYTTQMNAGVYANFCTVVEGTPARLKAVAK
jgi:hypothetical protein